MLSSLDELTNIALEKKNLYFRHVTEEPIRYWKKNVYVFTNPS
jgi:hypothetical protein